MARLVAPATRRPVRRRPGGRRTSRPVAGAPTGERDLVGYDFLVNIETRKKGDVIIVDFEGRLAVGVGDELLPRLVEQLLNEGNRKILLNLSDMDYIDSNGLGELVQSLKTSKRFGASLRLLKPQDRVRKTLRLTNLLPMFSVYETEAEALKGFASEA
jgi:anti-sigma B factor antagonist